MLLGYAKFLIYFVNQHNCSFLALAPKRVVEIPIELSYLRLFYCSYYTVFTVFTGFISFLQGTEMVVEGGIKMPFKAFLLAKLITSKYTRTL